MIRPVPFSTDLLTHCYRSSPSERVLRTLSPYAIAALPLPPPWGIRPGSERRIVIRVITSSPSTLLSAESASSAKVVRQTSAVRVCISPIQSEGSSADIIPSPRHSGSGVDARQKLAVYHWGSARSPFRTALFLHARPTGSLTIVM